MKKTLRDAMLACMLALTTGGLEASAATSEAKFNEKNGLVVVEAENVTLAGEWEVATATASYTGDGYLHFTGKHNGYPSPERFDSLLTYKVKINNPGTYRFKWRSRNGDGAIKSDEENDTWLMINADDFYGVKAGQKVDSNHHYMKVWIQDLNNWSWNMWGEHSGINGLEIYATFNSPGIYDINIIGRSKGHVVDRLVLYKEGVPGATNANTPETLFEPTITIAAPVNKKVPQEADLTVAGTANIVNEKITKVELYFDGTKVTEQTYDAADINYNLTVPKEKVTAGAHTFYLKAYSDNNRSTTSEVTSISATNELPALLTDDAYYQTDRGSFNSYELRLDNGWRESYMKFDFSEIKKLASMNSMILKLRVSEEPGNGTVTIKRGNHSNWTQTSLTPQNMPIPETGVLDSSTGSLEQGKTYIYDLTQTLRAIQNGSNPLDANKLTLILSMNSGGNNVSFASNENPNASLHPELILATAQYTKEYTVTFNAGNNGSFGSGDTQQTIPEGSNAVAPKIIPGSYMTFIGWDTNFNNVTRNMTVTARYNLALNGEGAEDPVVRPPVQNGLYLWLNANVRAQTDGTGNLISWQNLANGEMIYPQGPIKPQQITTLDKSGTAEPKTYKAIRFDGWSYLDYDSPSDLDGPTTFFVTYSREASQIEESIYYRNQRVISSLDPNSNNDVGGAGFNITTGDNLAAFTPMTYSFHSDMASIKKLCIGANREHHAQGFKGDILEVLIYNRKLTETERMETTNKLTSKWYDKREVVFNPGPSAKIASGSSSQSVDYMQPAAAPTLQILDNTKKHIGWDTNFNSVTQSMTVNALYEDYPITEIELKKGYNLVYLNIDPIDASMNSILKPITEQLISITDKDGNDWTFENDEESAIRNWKALKGYMIRVSDDVKLEVAGPHVQMPPSIDLDEGINIIPFTGTTTTNAQGYFKEILEHIDYIRSEKGNSIRSINNMLIDEIQTVEPKKSYIVKMKKDTTFFFPEN